MNLRLTVDPADVAALRAAIANPPVTWPHTVCGVVSLDGRDVEFVLGVVTPIPQVPRNTTALTAALDTTEEAP